MQTMVKFLKIKALKGSEEISELCSIGYEPITEKVKFLVLDILSFSSKFDAPYGAALDVCSFP